MKLILQAIKALFRKIEASIDNVQATANSAQATADNAQSTADSKMSATNPVGSGSFSMGRKPGSHIGPNSHAEGQSTTASGNNSHAEGYNTTASIPNQHVQGTYNAIDIGGHYAHIVGNGVTNNERRNIHALDWDGNAYYKGTVYVNGTNPDASGGQEVATKSGWTPDKFIGTDENGNLIEKDAPAGGGSGDMQKSVYDPNNNAKDIFKYADDVSKIAVTNHALSNTAHSDIRDLITGLTDRLNVLADSDDTTLDQLSEIVAYIKSNKSLIDAITTEKVSVSDIVDNLTTNDANKPLSAAQGVALKALINAIVIPDKLPNPNALTFSGAITGSYDGSSPLTVNIPSGGGGSGDIIDVLIDVTIEEAVAAVTVTLDTPRAYKELYIATCVYGDESNSSANAMFLRVNNTDTMNSVNAIAWIPAIENATSATTKSYGVAFVKLLHDCSFYYCYGSKSANARTPNASYGEMNAVANRETVISTLKFQSINQWTKFGVGSTIKVYGVRS